MCQGGGGSQGALSKERPKQQTDFTQEIARHEKNCTAENSIDHKLLTMSEKLLLENRTHTLFQVVADVLRYPFRQHVLST